MIYSANLYAYSVPGTVLGTGVHWKEDLVKVTKKTQFNSCHLTGSWC